MACASGAVTDLMIFYSESNDVNQRKACRKRTHVCRPASGRSVVIVDDLADDDMSDKHRRHQFQHHHGGGAQAPQRDEPDAREQEALAEQHLAGEAAHVNRSDDRQGQPLRARFSCFVPCQRNMRYIYIYIYIYILSYAEIDWRLAAVGDLARGAVGRCKGFWLLGDGCWLLAVGSGLDRRFCRMWRNTARSQHQSTQTF